MIFKRLYNLLKVDITQSVSILFLNWIVSHILVIKLSDLLKFSFS